MVLKKETESFPKYTLEKLWVQLLEKEVVEIWISLPSNFSADDTLPFVLVNHSHDGNYAQGKDENYAGTHYLQAPGFSIALAEIGVATVSIDARLFGSRAYQNEWNAVKETLLYGETVWGQMLYDAKYLLDFLFKNYHVKNLGVMGMSMGGLASWWLGILDKRIDYIVDIGAQVDYETLIEENLLSKHGFYHYIPKLLRYYSTKELQSMIAPTPRLSLVGTRDGNCPQSGVIKLDRHLKRVYQSFGVPENWKSIQRVGEHEEKEWMREAWIGFIKHHSKIH